MKTKRRQPIPQHEFGFTPATFNLIQDFALDGWRVAREHKDSEQVRRQAEANQSEIIMAPMVSGRCTGQRRPKC
jgi:hypothetical protein